MLLASVNVDAHSWFPQECCNEGHCKIATKWVQISSGHRLVTSEDGTFMVDENFPVKDSQDEKNWICVYQKKVYCLFRAPSM